MYKLGIGFAKSALWKIAALVLGLSTLSAAQAIQCGDTITSDTTLTANLGPCPGDALILQGTEITLI